MPTHKGTSQTDITAGSGGTRLQVVVAFDLLLADAGVTAASRAAPGAWSFDVHDAAGTCLGSLAAAWTAAVLGGPGSSTTTTDRFDPAPVSGAPTWPATEATTARRDWQQALTRRGATWATGDMAFELVGAAEPGAELVQTLLDADDHALVLHLELRAGGAIVLAGTVRLATSFPVVERGLSAAPPVVDDVLT